MRYPDRKELTMDRAEELAQKRFGLSFEELSALPPPDSAAQVVFRDAAQQVEEERAEAAERTYGDRVLV